MDKSELTALKKKLPKGWGKILADEFNCSPVTVCHAMNGKHNRSDIIAAAVELVKRTTLATQQNVTAVLRELNKLED